VVPQLSETFSRYARRVETRKQTKCLMRLIRIPQSFLALTRLTRTRVFPSPLFMDPV
jgi:hypothetical protein